MREAGVVRGGGGGDAAQEGETKRMRLCYETKSDNVKLLFVFVFIVFLILVI